MYRHLRERSVESGYTLRNFSELKSGGDNSYAVPPRPEKWGGGGRVPPVPHRSTPVIGCRVHVIDNKSTYTLVSKPVL